MKKINFPLLIGSILIMVILLVAFFPQFFTNKDPNYQQTVSVKQIIENDRVVSSEILSSPWGPNEDNIMGTDDFGRDVYARLIYGTKTTMKTAFLIVLFRLLIALPLGLLAGIGSKAASSFIRFFYTVFTAIPLLLVAFIVFNIGYFASLHLEASIIAFAVVLSILGWGKLGKQIEEKVVMVMKEDFIEGEIALGKNKFQIVTQNIIPHLLPFLVSTAFIEMGLSIFLLAQLSVLEIFVGPRLIKDRNDALNMHFAIAAQPEWASILSGITRHNRVGNYWLGIYPALVFSLGILAFNLTGEGLRMEFEKRNSRVISFIRRISYSLSPRLFAQQISNFKEYSKPVITKTLSITLIIVYILLPAKQSLHPFDLDMATSHLEEFVKPEYKGRLAFSEGNYLAGNYIVDKLREYGIEPLLEDSYIQEFEYTEAMIPYIQQRPNLPVLASPIEYATIKLTDMDGAEFTYKIDEDFKVAALPSTLSNSNEEEVYAGISDLNNRYIGNLSGENTENSIAVETLSGYRDILHKIPRTLEHQIYFWLIEDELHQAFPTYSIRANSIAIIPRGEMAKKIASDKYEVEIKIKKGESENFSDKGRNILGVIPGKDWDKPDDINNKKDLIIVGAPYDGLGMLDGKVGAIRATAASINLEIARIVSQLEEPLDKTIVFAFWDGDSVFNIGGSYYSVNKGRIFSSQHYNITYFDVGYASNEKRVNLDIATSTLGELQVNTYHINEGLNSRLKKQKIPYAYRNSNSKAFRNIGITLSLKIAAGSGHTSIIDTKNDTLENINKRQMKNIGQVITDLLTMDENFN